jgi:1-acyl-sn-glycerol-3-phosphate acyltransferase
MRGLIAWLRFVAVILSMSFLVVAVFILYHISLKLIRYPIRKIWTRCLLLSTGGKINLHGVDLSSIDLRNTMVVSNHISWLDTVVMLRLCYLRYIGKVEMLKWPFLSMIIKAGGTIFINRRNKRELLTLNQQVANVLTDGATIGLYPEGTTSDGVKILPFKAPILEAALMAKSNVIPVVLSYRKEDNKLATEVTFSKVNWLTTVINTLKLENLVINVTILPIVRSTDFKTRDELAVCLYQQINQSYQNQQ